MIDIHCHLLPGLDDGAGDLEQALGMARMAVANGINYAVLTPHLHPGRYENTRSLIESHWQRFQQELERADIPLETGMAAEVRLAPEILALVDEGKVPFLGEVAGYRVMLLEFPHTHIPPGADRLVLKLLARGVRPIIAHPERNKDVIRDLDKLEPFVELGCLLQLTAGAVAGRFGAGPQETALQLLELEACVVLASDAHNLSWRVPDLREGLAVATEILGADAANDLVDGNPLAIIDPQIASMSMRKAIAVGSQST